VVYTDRRGEVIRTSLKEYYEFQHAGPRKASWGGICDEIFDYTNVRVRIEVVRQWVTQFVQKGRKRPLRPNAKELDSIVAFLMHPDIDMLLPEELEDPEPPYRFLHSFLKFLSSNTKSRIISPAWTSNGVYESWHQVEETDQIEEKWIKTNLTLEVDPNSNIVRARERWEVHFRGADGVTVFGGSPESEGWGIVTPEGNLFLFMKTKPFVRNYYYFSIAAGSQNLTLLRHERPAVNCDPPDKIFEELMRETKEGMLLLIFNKVLQSNANGGDRDV
jgi:hypothetical protein